MLLAPHDPLLAVIGPSGSGKSTAVRRLVERGTVSITPSWTTRPPRSDESDGCPEHRFLSDSEFDAAEAAGVFLETVTLFGLPYRYGLPAVERTPGDTVPLIMVRAPLLPLVVRHYANATVYQIEDTIARVTERLQARYPDITAAGSRIADYESEVALGRRHAHRVFINSGSDRDLVEQLADAVAVDFPAAVAATR